MLLIGWAHELAHLCHLMASSMYVILYLIVCECEMSNINPVNWM
jgi:hypothetical protein